MPGTWVTRCHRCGATAADGRLVQASVRRPGKLVQTVFRCEDAAACAERSARR